MRFNKKLPIFVLIMNQVEAVRQTIEMLGGVATLAQINQNVFKIGDCQWKTKTPYASIRRIVRHNKVGIYRIKPGLYGLETFRRQLEANGMIEETPANRDTEAMREFNHYYYQGLLVEYGNMKQMGTYVPRQDFHRRYSNRELGEVCTLKSLPHFSTDKVMRRSSTIDVIWFNKRDLPDSFFEVEHSTDFQNSLLKYDDLCDFSARMIIVADRRRKAEFDKKIKAFAFEPIASRVEFLSYDSLIRQYNMAQERMSLDVLL